MKVETNKDNNGIKSNITGRFETIEGKNSSYQKFVLTTDLATVESTDDYYNLVIKIYYSGDNNWDYFEQYYLRITNNTATLYESKKNTTEQGCIFLYFVFLFKENIHSTKCKE